MLTPLYYDEPTHAHGAALRTNGNGAVVGDNGHGHNLQDAPAGDDAVPVAVAEAKLEALHVTEYRPEDGGILDAWLDVYGPSALWATGFDEWLIWNGRYWERDCELIIEGQIISILDAFNQQARDLARDARDKLAGAFVTATKRTKARVASVEGMARAMRTVLGDKLDSNALLNLRNCTLELGTFQTHPHSPADLLTYCTDYDYDQTAVAVNWMRALERQPEAVRQFLQEFAGLSLTPDCKHELALWFVGAPGTGKSTAVHGFQVMLGAKAGQLSLADVEKGRFALADLPGKTLVTATEQPSDYITTAHTLNAIISGEPLRVEQKYRNATTITSRAKMLWAMNDLPRVKDANSGLFRRVKIVEWPAIPADEVDKDLRKAISVEGAGILNWALEGLRRLQARNSFIIPDEVVTATERFKHQSDIAGNFRDECLRVGDGLEVKSGELYMAYKEWTLANGTKPKSSVSVADEWRRLGFERSERRMDGYYWMGCELNGNGRKHLERGELR
jgi:putative DNA primase/helicase